MQNVNIAATGNEADWKEIGAKPPAYNTTYKRYFRFRASRLDNQEGEDKVLAIGLYLRDKFVERYGKVFYIDSTFCEQDGDNAIRGLVTFVFTIFVLE